jgi:drug/metabolite transporter (DMT)-like permease|tara:strand:- start:1780 stop:2625 length:846 start_codon:yes stop_codon:yes gene_type:complete
MATNSIIAKGGVIHVPPISLAFYRWFFVFLILLPFVVNSILENRNYLIKESKELFFLGFMGCGICGAFPFLAGLTTTVTNIGIIYTSSPIFIILISSIFFKEKIFRLQIVGLALCLLGVFLIIMKGKISLLLSLKFTTGDLWVLGAAIGWALYAIFLLRWKSRFSFFARFCLIAFMGSVSLLPFMIVENVLFRSINFDKYFYFWTLFAAFSPGIIAYTIHQKVQRSLGASTTGFILYLFAIYGAFYGIIFFNEKLEFYHYSGALLVFLGVFFAKKKNFKSL